MASIDCYLTVKNQQVLRDFELNPWGVYLIDLDNGGVSIFIGVKVFGTCVSLGILALLWQWNRLYANIVISAISVLAALLLLFMVSN